MKVDLEKELVSNSAKTLNPIREFDAVKEVKLLLAANDAKSEAILRNFELDDSLKQVQQQRGRLMELESFEKEYGNAYHIENIKALAIKYRLRFLPLNTYKGAIDPFLAQRLAEFGEKHNIDVTSPGVQDEFYVLAPSEDFKLTKETHTKIIVRPIVSLDPLLFYRGSMKGQDNRDGQFWTLIHKWGSEFNILRLARAIPFRNAKNLWVANALAYSAVAFLLITLLFSTFTMSLVAIAAISIVVGALGSCIRSANIGDTDAKNFFTANNWHDGRYHVEETRVEYR